MNFWKKKIKDTTLVANKLGVEEEKIKELKEGKRKISGETMDKVLKIVNENNVEQQMENVEIWNWYNNISSNDLVGLRLDFGYHTQRELAEKLKETTSAINRFENKKIDRVNRVLKKIYYFFNNDFNKKIETEEIPTEKDEVLEWINSCDLKGLRKKYNLKQKDIYTELNMKQSTYSTIELQNRRNVKYIKTSRQIKQIYDYFKNKESNLENEIDNAQPINPNYIIEAEETKEMDVVNNKDEQKIEITEKDRIAMLESEINYLQHKNEELNKQIRRYEKLIDML